MDTTLINPLLTLAEVYDCSTYGDGNYDEGGLCATTTGGVGAASDGALIDTGAPYFVPMVAGALLVVMALGIIITRIVRRRKTQ